MPKANHKVRLTLNIGAKDKKRLGLDEVEAKAGDVVSVSEDAAKILRDNGWAVESTAELPQDVAAVPAPVNVPVDSTESRDTNGPALTAAQAQNAAENAERSSKKGGRG